jgi:hypothetical protein
MIGNSMFIVETPIELVIDAILYLIIILINFLSFTSFSFRDSLGHFFLLVLSIPYIILLGNPQIEMLLLLLMVYHFRKSITTSTLNNIGRTILVVISLILLVHISGIYSFPVNPYQVLKGDRVQLGFRNINTYGFYALGSISIFFLNKKKKLLLMSIIVLLVSTIYSKTTTPVIIVVLGSVLYLIFSYLEKMKKIFIAASLFLTTSLFATGMFTVLGIDFIVNSKMKFYGITLNELTSYRLVILRDELKANISLLDWLFGFEADELDSIYFYIIVEFGALFTITLFFILLYNLFRRQLLSIKNSTPITVAMCLFLLIGIIEMPISPYNVYAIHIFSLLMFVNYSDEKKIKKLHN